MGCLVLKMLTNYCQMMTKTYFDKRFISTIITKVDNRMKENQVSFISIVYIGWSHYKCNVYFTSDYFLLSLYV